MEASDTRPLSIDLSGKRRETFDSVFYRWAINVGKTIIVIVELVALSALFYRFYIDRQLVDQRDAIAKKALLVNAQQKDIDELESIQSRILAIDTTQESTEATFGVVLAIRQALESGLFQSGEVSISQDTITFQALAPSIVDIENFSDKLSSNPAVKQISLDDITSSDQGNRFTMNIELVAREPIL